MASLDAGKYFVGCGWYPESNVGSCCSESGFFNYVRHWYVGLVFETDL